MSRNIGRSLGLLTLALSLATLVSGCGGGGSSATTATGSAAPATTALATQAGADVTAPSALPPIVLSSSDASGSARAMSTASPSGSRALEVSYLNSVVPPDLTAYAHLEVGAVSDLTSMSDGAGPFLGLRSYYGQPLVNSGVRAEVSVDYPFTEGQTIRYSWRFGITSNFTSDAPTNRWWLFGDWHDQPNPNLGETWVGFPSHSPSVGFGYGQISGQDYLALLYGAPNPATVGLIPFSRGVWHSMVVEIAWSLGAAGRVAVYLDGASTPIQQAQGANMYNNYQHYLKLGSYREPDIAGDTWVYVRDVKIEHLN
jgi:hypothetical protein